MSNVDKKEVDVVETIENKLNCKLYPYQKELIKSIFGKTDVSPYLIIPRRKV